LFLSKGRPSTFDGPSHLANIAQFTKALQSGDFPVRWMDGFGNYGMPMAIIIQQTTSYLGAIITLFTHDIFISYNIVVLIGAFFSTYLLYCFFTLHFSEEAALLGATLFNFAPYRIINIYVRGALPEFFSHVFFPVVFIGLYLFIKKRSMKGLIYLFIYWVCWYPINSSIYFHNRHVYMGTICSLSCVGKWKRQFHQRQYLISFIDTPINNRNKCFLYNSSVSGD